MAARALILILAMALSSVTARTSDAQTFWEPTSGPEGGLITAMTVDSFQHAICGTATAGAFTTTNNGDTWFPINQHIGTSHIKYLESSAKGYVFALTFNNGMYRYELNDVSYTWFHLDSLQYGIEINGFVIDTGGGLFVIVPRHGVVRSTDNGNHWLASASEVADSSSRAIGVSPAGELVIITNYGAVFTSTDRGSTWQKRTPSPNGKDVTSIAFANDGAILLADQWGIIYRSQDTASTWQKVYTQSAARPWYSIVTDRSSGYIYGRTGDGWLYRSTDGGTNWAFIDSTVTDGDFFPLAATHDSHLFAGTDFYGVMRSSSSGTQWQFVNKGIDAYQIVGIASDSVGNVVALTERLAFRSTDRGDHWQRLPINLGDNFQNPPIAIDRYANIFVGTETGVARSTDSGQTWRYTDSIPKGQTGNLASDLAIDDESSIYAATNNGLVKSLDHGVTWLPVSGDPSGTGCSRVVVGKNGVVYTGTVTGIVYRSGNRGANWTTMGTQAGIRAVLPDETLFAVSQGLYRSKDHGMTWIQLNPFPLRPAARIFDIVRTSHNELLLAVDSGAYRSTDGGDTWIDVSKGLVQSTFVPLIGCTTYAENPSGSFYAATRGVGVYRSIGALNDVAIHDEIAEHLHSYPNPFSRDLWVELRLETPANARVELFDMLGRSFGVLANGWMPAGKHAIHMTTMGLPAGIYLCRETVEGWVTTSRVVCEK